MNERKRFVKCVDCGCQTLPRSARTAGQWAAAAALYTNGRVNEGALCPQCANRRRLALGLDAVKAPCNRMAEGCAPTATAMPKRVTINKQEYAWELTTLDSLIVKWKEQHLDEKYRNLDPSWWLVVVNDQAIAAGDFASVPISDGDAVSIVLGRGRYF